MTSRPPVSLDTTLNKRQRDVLFLLCKGLRNAEVARQLGISERTVKWYVSQLFLIFDVTNRTELAGRAALESSLFCGANTGQFGAAASDVPMAAAAISEH